MGDMEAFYGDRYYWSESGDAAEEIARLLATVQHSSVGVFIDRNVPYEWLVHESLGNEAFVQRIDGGEEAKTLAGVTRFIGEHQRHLDRNSVVVVAGGGATLDLLGLCCGLMYRGIRYISVPTSLIALADAAYGGKTAVNYGAKNQIGMYHHPQMVYANPGFLRSLPDVHLRSGMIEVAKLAVFFADIRDTLDAVRDERARPGDAARLAARRKLELLELDPYEENGASVLLYGHPLGNAFETFVSERHARHLPHGLAVALGISFSAWLSERLGKPEDRHREQLALVADWLDPVPFARESTPASAHELLGLLARDKYAGAEVLMVPAICDIRGYTPVPLETIGVEYEAWRGWLLSQPGAGVTGSGEGAIRASEPSSAYIAGSPTDETVAPLQIVSADGPFLVTSAGRRILDWATCLNAPFGHGERLETSALPVNAGNYRTAQRDAVVRRLHDLFPALAGFQFRSSGTEAVEAGMRYLATAFGATPHMVTVEGCYHGLTLGARSLMGTAGDAGITITELPFWALLDPSVAASELRRILSAGPAAVWLEGVQGATLRRLPAEFLALLTDLQAEYPGRLALVCDDMLASIRCGAWCSLNGALEPDVLIAGKSWACGYPFSFFGVAPWVRKEGGDILGTTSYGGNPIACAYAAHTIDRIVRGRLLDRIGAIESGYAHVLADGLAGLESVVRNEWHGLLFGFEMRNTERALEVARRAADGGLLVSQLGPVIRCSPPLDIRDELLDQGLQALLAATRASA
jgi:3-dehydroquinate synthase